MKFLQYALVIGFVSACAGKPTYLSPKGMVTIDHEDAVELNEAFKTASEKTISLPTLGDVVCTESECVLPVKGTAEMLRDGQDRGIASVNGGISCTSQSVSLLLKLMDRARNDAKTMVGDGENGHTTCDGKGCRLEFAMEPDGKIPMLSVMARPHK